MNQALKFLGRGSAFNVEEGNTSAYFIKDNILFLIDCGETVFYELKSCNKLQHLIKEHDIKDIHVYITHLHSDHIGSLSSLIYYCYYVLGMEIKIHYPDIDRFYFGYNSPLIQLLTLQGNVIDTHYEFLLEPHECICSKKVTHVNEFKSYSYTINLDDDKKIYYSGDCKEIESELIEINNGSYNQVYLESCLNESAVHMCIDYLDEVISKDKTIRDRIYIMHIDSLDLIEKVKEYGFKVVELNG